MTEKITAVQGRLIAEALCKLAVDGSAIGKLKDVGEELTEAILEINRRTDRDQPDILRTPQ